MAVAGPVWAVRTVTVPCSRQGPYRDTPTRSGGSKHHPKPRSTDQCQGMSASCVAGQTTTWDGTSAIFTLKPGPGAAHADTHRCNERSAPPDLLHPLPKAM